MEIDELVARLQRTSPAVAVIVDKVSQGRAALGAIIGGSYAYGVPRGGSDLDITVVVPDGEARREAFDVGQCRIDLWTRSVENVRNEFRRRALPGTLEMFSLGVIAFDNQGVVAELQQEAKRLWQAGPPIGPMEIERRESRLNHLATVFDELVSEPQHRRALLRSVIMNEVVSYWYAWRRRYRRAPLAAMDEIYEDQKSIVELLCDMEDEHGFGMRALVGETVRLTKQIPDVNVPE